MISFHRRLLPSTLCLLALLATARADVTLRPNEKPKQTTSDFTKDQKKNGFVAPEPVDVSASYVVGQSVQIELRVATAYLGFVKFVVRDQPKYGVLSEIRPSPSGESNRALVTYTHNGNTEELFDRFTFAARIGDGPASAPGVVSLNGRKAMARLDVLEQPRFKQMQPGDQDSATFVVFNGGNAPFSGDITLSDPFSGPRHLDLAVNEKLSVLVLAKPLRPGAYHLDLEIQPGVASSRLRGLVECAQPFVVSPGSLALAYDPASGQRKGVVKVANGSASALLLKVEGDKRLAVAGTLSLEPHETVEMPVSLPKNDVAAYRGEVSLIQEPSRQKVMIYADPKPAQIRLVTPSDGKIDFGTVQKGKKVEARISLTNDGGVPAVLQASQVPPFLINTELSKVKAEPGQMEEIVIAFAPELPGVYNQTLSIGGNAGRIELAIRGTMVDPSRPNTGTAPGASVPGGAARPKEVEAVPARPSSSRPSASAPAVPPAPAPVMVSRPPPSAPAPAPRPSASAAAPAPEAPAKKPELILPMSKMSPQQLAAYGKLVSFGVSPTTVPQFQSDAIERVPSIGVAERGKDNITLLWEEPKIAPTKYLVETSYMVQNTATGLWLKVWKPHDAWEKVKSPKPGIAAAKVTALTPETRYELRVLGIDKDGKFSRPSDIVQVETISPFRLPGWIWPALGAVILLAVVYTGYQLKQGDWQT